MKFFKKKNNIPVTSQKEVDGAEVWLVSWDSRYGEYSSSVERVAKAFLTEDDAIEFADKLREAKALLQYRENIHIDIKKQS